jgi:regulation of enolase protein 1 (concanavalin A-like superfamily)
LLDRISPSFLTSPPMIAVGGIMALLYGIVLFAWVTDSKKKRLEAEAAPPPETVVVALPTVTPVPPVATTPDHVSKAIVPPRPTPKEAPKAAPQPPIAVARNETPKAASPVPSPEPRKVAANPPPRPVPPPPPAIESWRGLSGSPGDCQFRIDGPLLTVTVPASLHLPNPEVGKRNSPHLLTDVTGDFVAQVKVAGQVRTGTQPLPDFPFPPFQGAGLLLWQDENNYLRLERTSIYSPEGRRLHQVMLELCRDGKTLPGVFRDARDEDIILKFDRRGSEVRCSYSPDGGRSWPEIKRQMVTFPAGVKVGVSVSNASPRPFSPRFEGWDLSGPGAKAGQGM